MRKRDEKEIVKEIRRRMFAIDTRGSDGVPRYHEEWRMEATSAACIRVEERTKPFREVLQINDHLSENVSFFSSDAFEAFQDASLWYKNCTLIYVDSKPSPQRLAFLP